MNQRVQWACGLPAFVASAIIARAVNLCNGPEATSVPCFGTPCQTARHWTEQGGFSALLHLPGEGAPPEMRESLIVMDESGRPYLTAWRHPGQDWVITQDPCGDWQPLAAE